MSRVDVVILGAVIVVMGCATVQKEGPQPTSRSRVARAPSVAPRVRRLAVDGRAPAHELGARLSAGARALGVSGSVAFVWGDVAPVPSGAERVELRADGVSVSGYLVPNAHEVDMGQLAEGIHDVLMVSCDERGLYGTHPSGRGRTRLELGVADAEARREAEETFAFVSLMPGDLPGGATSGQILGLLAELPTRVRYAVLALPG